MIEKLKLTNTTLKTSVVIDQYDSEFVLGEVDFGSVSGTHQTYKYTNQVGVSIGNTTLGERTISIQGWVIGETYNKVRSNKSILNRIVNPLNTVDILAYDSYKLSFKPDSSIYYSPEYESNNEVLCEFLIQGTCADPLFSLSSDAVITIATTRPRWKFPLVIPKNSGVIMGLREPSLLATLVNQGDVDVGMIITFSCVTSVTNPSLLNVITQEYVKIDKVISPGEKVIVSTVVGNRYVKGVLDGKETNYFKYRDISSTWLQLYRGDNTLKYGADENPEGLEVSITYSPKFLEVQ